jgi:hypothetical protein
MLVLIYTFVIFEKEKEKEKLVSSWRLMTPYIQMIPFSFLKRRRRRRTCSSIKSYSHLSISSNRSILEPPVYTFCIFEKDKDKDKLFIDKVICQYLPLTT